MTQTFMPGPGQQRAYRTALAAFATGVTVVTCRSDEGPLGFTASSFTSVSLDPPLVLWCPAVTSPRHDAFAAAEHFSIHVLGVHQRALSDRFAMDARDFTGVDWSEGPAGVPLLADCPSRLDCRLFATYPGGDHTIVLGQVERVVHTPGAPLVFALGSYGRFDEEI
ncbi:flavin reductase family protein [Tropicimonas sp. IMCC34043]|uniref:flavin reductase family protein n=1 Tax=Tropicimonas sp. IMCC34043 TaxID=2248760 RepID=UPI000E2633AB|nr:flavin reductase family protein [Tropicimonas sp. IMCC34043]